MRYRPHDLITVENPVFDRPLPKWVEEALAICPIVVVRRGTLPEGWIPVGIRGKGKEQRFACGMRADGSRKTDTPETLLTGLLAGERENPFWKEHLQGLAPLTDPENKEWEDVLSVGIGGSVGYELASGRKVTNPRSDADLLIRLAGDEEGKIQRNVCRRLLAYLDDFPCPVDPVLITVQGWASLREYAGNSRGVLVKTDSGCYMAETLTVEKKI